MRFAACSIAFLFSSVAAFAQAPAETTQPVSASAPAPAFRQIVLPPNTDIIVTPNDLLTSKSLKVGETFILSTGLDVMQDGFVVIPRGTVGQGTVTYRTGKGVFGKSAKMEVTFNWLNLGGRRIALTGKYRQEGEGNTGATVGVVVAVGVLGGIFVTGHSATIPSGQQLHAHTAEAVSFNVPAGAVLVPTAVVAPVAVPAVTPAAPSAH